MNNRAFTFFQMMVVLAIISLVVALSLPLIAKAKDRAKISSCVNMLQQYGAAIAIYRNEYDGDGKFGSQEEMGLPPTPFPLDPILAWPKGKPHCVGVSAQGYERPVLNVFWMGSKDWSDYANEHGAGSILMGDLNHNQGLPTGSPYMLTTGVGLYESGNVKVIRRRGNPRVKQFWN
jgi:hypothetical protein